MNYAELSMAVADWLNKPSIEKIMPAIVRFGQRRLEDDLRIRPMEFRPEQEVLAEGTGSISLPDDFLELLFLQLIKDDVRWVINVRLGARDMYEEMYSVVEKGAPSAVTRVGDTFEFDLLLDSPYTRDWCYYRRLPTLVASAAGDPPGNSNWWSVHAEEAFLMSCLSVASLYVTGVQDGDKKKWAEGYASAIDALRRREDRESTGGTVHRSVAWKI